jgi:hypothetical protein
MKGLAAFLGTQCRGPKPETKSSMPFHPSAQFHLVVICCPLDVWRRRTSLFTAFRPNFVDLLGIVYGSAQGFIGGRLIR